MSVDTHPAAKCADCDRLAEKRGFCGRCYVRHYRAGDLPPRAPKPPCSVCGEPSHAKGYCALHYYRQLAGKDPAVTPVRSLPDEERFWSYVDKSPGPDACWPWTGSLQTEGYGVIYWKGRQALAHRIAYLLERGEVPRDMPHVDHVRALGCRLRNCCNPAHLEAVTQAENNRRAPAGRRVLAGQLRAEQARREREARLWSKAHVGEAEECWPWHGFIDKAGTPRIWWEGGGHDVRRIIWRLSHGEIPQEHSVRGDSDTCVNPAHLRLVKRGRGNHGASEA
jgi:hypothetical protein